MSAIRATLGPGYRAAMRSAGVLIATVAARGRVQQRFGRRRRRRARRLGDRARREPEPAARHRLLRPQQPLRPPRAGRAVPPPAGAGEVPDDRRDRGGQLDDGGAAPTWAPRAVPLRHRVRRRSRAGPGDRADDRTRRSPASVTASPVRCVPRTGCASAPPPVRSTSSRPTSRARATTDRATRRRARRRARRPTR